MLDTPRRAPGLRFERLAPPAPSAAHRADVALFVGLVARRRARGGGVAEAPREVLGWLDERGWTRGPYARIGPPSSPSDAEADVRTSLFQVPVPIESWNAFDLLFDWDRRDLDGRGASGTTYLGAAVRSFFAQGGRRCYVVRAGDPRPITEPRSARLPRIDALVPGYPHYPLSTEPPPSPLDRRSWRGIAHLFGLPDVSLVCLPDLVELVASERTALTIPAQPALEEQFVACSDDAAPAADEPPVPFGAPRCDESGYEAWALAIAMATDLVATHHPEAMVLADLPIADRSGGDGLAASPLMTLHERGWLRGAQAATGPHAVKARFTSAFLQLAYPWLRTLGSSGLPDDLEPPCGVLAGVLARNALLRGTFRSAANLPISYVYDVFPFVGREQMLEVPAPPPGETFDRAPRSLVERVSLFGTTPSGMRLLSDVTTSADERYRTAGASRLVSALVRATRTLGEDLVFEVSSEAVWATLRDRLNGMLLGLWQSGALRGASADEAFEVRCDRSTMSQSDLDAGRIVTEVRFEAASAIEGVTVVLSMTEGGRVSLLSAER